MDPDPDPWVLPTFIFETDQYVSPQFPFSTHDVVCEVVSADKWRCLFVCFCFLPSFIDRWGNKWIKYASVMIQTHWIRRPAGKRNNICCPDSLVLSANIWLWQPLCPRQTVFSNEGKIIDPIGQWGTNTYLSLNNVSEEQQKIFLLFLRAILNNDRNGF